MVIGLNILVPRENRKPARENLTVLLGELISLNNEGISPLRTMHDNSHPVLFRFNDAAVANLPGSLCQSFEGVCRWDTDTCTLYYTMINLIYNPILDKASNTLTGYSRLPIFHAGALSLI